MTEIYDIVSQNQRRKSRSRGFNLTFIHKQGESILPSISKFQRKASINMSVDLSDDTQTQIKYKRRRHASIDFDRDSVISKISMRNKLLSSKISKLNNYWNKKCSDEKRSKPVKATRKILMFKKVSDPENKNKMRMVTKHMSPEKAELFKQLFRKFIE